MEDINVNDQIPISNDQSNPNDQNPNVIDATPSDDLAQKNSGMPDIPQTPNETAASQPSLEIVKKQSPLFTFLEKFRQAIRIRKEKRLDKIIQFVSAKGQITNDKAEKLLRVSDKTAERYLSELVKQGKLSKIGSTSQIRYELPG